MTRPKDTARLRTGPKPKSTADRFWPKVDTNGPVIRPALGFCWIWTAWCFPNGYGSFGVGGHSGGSDYAHRVSWRLHFGSIPDGLRVLHKCDNPPCVRPDHLFLGTHADNMADMATKGRSTHGERGNGVKLTDALVIEIRTRYAAGGITQATLAAKYGVQRVTVTNLLSGVTWRHLIRPRD